MSRGDVVIGRIAFTPADWETIRAIRAAPYTAWSAPLAERLCLSRDAAKSRLRHLRLRTGTASLYDLIEWVWRNGEAIDRAAGDSPRQGRSETPPGNRLAAGAPVDLTMLGLALPLGAVEALRQDLTAALAGGGHTAYLDEWEEILEEYARSYHLTPTDGLLRDVTADLSVLQLQLESADGSPRRRFARVGAYLAAIAANAWLDAGELVYADRWWRTARQLADFSGDAEARAWVGSWEDILRLPS